MTEKRPDHYVAAGCPTCGRHRLELYVDEEERALGIHCEKCFSTWPLPADPPGRTIEGPYFEKDER